MNNYRGVILAGGSGTRLLPLTKIYSKQLLPIFDKPMIYYPLALLISFGIDDIQIVTDELNLGNYKKLLGSGEEFGITINYLVQTKPNGIAAALKLARRDNSHKGVALCLGDNLFLGLNENFLQVNPGKLAKIAAIQSTHPQDFGVIEFDEDSIPISIVEKPKVPLSDWIIPGVYLFDNKVFDMLENLQPSERGEFEIVDVIRNYLENGTLDCGFLDQKVAWFDTGNPHDLLRAGHFVESTQIQNNILIGSPHLEAIRQGFIESYDTFTFPQTEYYHKILSHKF